MVAFSRLKPKYPPSYVSMKILGIISHSCLIDEGSSPNIISKVIMALLGITCTSEDRNMLMFNNKIQPTIDQIKDLIITMCAHLHVNTTWKFLVANMEVVNFSSILG